VKVQYFLILLISFFISESLLIAQDFDPEFKKALEYYDKGQYGLAALEFESAIPIVEKENGKYDTTLLTPLLNYTGHCFHLSQNNFLAEKYLLQAKSIFDTLEVLYDYGYAAILNNLAQVYDAMGRYEKAEPMMLQVVEIDKNLLGEDHPDFAIDISNLAALYDVMGRYEQAEPLYKQAVEIAKTKLGTNDPAYSRYLNNLARSYFGSGRYEEAEPIMMEAVATIKISLGDDHPEYAKYLNNLGQLYYLIGHYSQAELCYKAAIKIAKSKLGENNPSYAIKICNLAALYTKTGRYSESEQLLFQAKAIDSTQLGENHPEYARILNNIARLFQETGRYDQVSLLNRKIFDIYRYQMKTNTGFLSEKEMALFLNTFLYHLDIFQSFNIQHINQQPHLDDFALDIELVRKGILLRSTIGTKTSILESKDTAMIKTYNDLFAIRKQVNKFTTYESEQTQMNIKELEQKANDLEKTLSLKSKDFQQAKLNNDFNWEAVKQNLKSPEAAIEFSSFHYYNGMESTDSILYCAIVLKSDDTMPRMVYLCEETQLKKAIPSSLGTALNEINSAYTGTDLYNLIWQPIDSMLSGTETIYFAPSGLLNSISIAAITCPDNKALMEKYNLVQLSSTRTLVMPEEIKAITKAAVYGGIKYDTDTVSMLSKAKKYHEKEDELEAFNRSARWNNRSGFRYLEGTQKEAEQITGKLNKKGISTISYSGEDALEESFVALSGNDSPSVIHISTHGFYYPDTISDENRKKMDLSGSGEVRFRYSDDPLLRSGLLMSGSNRAWKGLPIPAGIEDGILTAKEVSNMNLMNTELVVLSACQTGQGDVKGSEGVEGLQRGFKMAGVRYLIMSLWEIPDLETTEFMETFYDNWLGGQEIRDAFWNTQLKMKNKYSDEPFKWAGFVLME
jgi:CHAT domain-containing protein